MMVNDEQVASDSLETTPENENGATTNEPKAQEVPSNATPEPTPVPPTPAAETSSPAVETADDSALFDAAMAELMESPQVGGRENHRKLRKGDRIEATVIQVENDRVFVDLGTKAEGVVPLDQLSVSNIETAHGHVNVGDKIKVVVLRPDGGEGNPIVSKKQADFDEAWHKVVEAFSTGMMVKAQVVDRVKGGLVVDVGVRGFVPATHVGSGNLRNIDRFVGETLDLTVIELDKERKKVVLSNKAAEQQRMDTVRDELFEKVNVGDTVEGTVRRITDYGAFVDLGGIDGLLHISEMSWMRINHPKEVLKEGQKISVMVLRLDKEAGKVSLGLRQVQPDPWNLIKENYKIGQKLNCVINRLVQSGAFIRLPEGAEAFLPVSEITHRRINRPADELTENQEVELTIIDLRPDERRMVLSLKAGTPGESQIGYGYGPSSSNEYDAGRGRDRGASKGKKKKGGRDEESGGQRTSGGGATIGERLGLLKGFHFRSDEDEEAGAEEAPAESKDETASEG